METLCAHNTLVKTPAIIHSYCNDVLDDDYNTDTTLVLDPRVALAVVALIIQINLE